MTGLPCLGNEAFYDTARDSAAPTAERRQALRLAAALCAACPTPCEQQITSSSIQTNCCPIPSYGSYLAHKKRGEDACEASKAKKRDYDRERYARNPRRARAPQRAYEARMRAARRERIS